MLPPSFYKKLDELIESVCRNHHWKTKNLRKRGCPKRCFQCFLYVESFITREQYARAKEKAGHVFLIGSYMFLSKEEDITPYRIRIKEFLQKAFKRKWF